MFGGDKTCTSWLFVKHCEQTDHLPAMQQHLEKVEAIEVLHCTFFGHHFMMMKRCSDIAMVFDDIIMDPVAPECFNNFCNYHQ